MNDSTRIAFQGEHGAFSEAALFELRPEAATVPCRTFTAVVEAVASGIVDFGLLPVENTLELDSAWTPALSNCFPISRSKKRFRESLSMTPTIMMLRTAPLS